MKMARTHRIPDLAAILGWDAVAVLIGFAVWLLGDWLTYWGAAL